MVALLLLTLLQGPPPAAPPKPSPTNPNPATQTTKPKPRPASGATTTALLFITDTTGTNIEGVEVRVMGPVDREATSPFSGPTRIQGLRAGTYRVRFTKEGFITFEKELTWRAGTAAPEVAVTLNPAPETPAPAPAPPPVVKPEPPSTKLPPPGTPKTMPLIDFIEKNLISGKEAQKENLIGCSGVGQSLLWQIRDPWTGRKHDSADLTVYVIAGEGTLRLDDRDVSVTNGSFAVVPHGTTYGFTRRGRNPLIVLAVLAGAPCAAE
ncbi:MAG TPA: carboxypeptidase regulatory-like domain-containing protein [Vicinamibacterales bacterium]